MKQVNCGNTDRYYVVLNGDYLHFNTGMKTIATINVRDYAEVYKLIKQMRSTYRGSPLSYKANVALSNMFFPPHRTQKETLKTNTLFIYYACEQEKHYHGIIRITDRYKAHTVFEDNGSGNPDEVFEMDLCGEQKLRDSVDKYLHDIEKVECVIDGQTLYLSRESVEQLKKLGR